MQLNITGATVNEEQRVSGLCINSGCGTFPFWLRLCICFGLNFSSGVNWTSGKLLNLLDPFLINKINKNTHNTKTEVISVLCGHTVYWLTFF